MESNYLEYLNTILFVLQIPLRCVKQLIEKKDKHNCLTMKGTQTETNLPLGRSKPSSKIFLLNVSRRCLLSIIYVFLSCFVMLSCMSVC